MGVEDGFLKLVVRREDRVVVGAHIIGPMASELIHYGVSLVENQSNLDQVISRIFNFPTLHDLYKYASYDALGALAGHRVKNGKR
jgi:NAD(P) transhydrogenase